MDEASRVALPDAGLVPDRGLSSTASCRSPGATTTSSAGSSSSPGPWRRRVGSASIRWLSIFLGLAGTYRKHDTVDVVYESDGKRLVATGLPPLSATAGTRSRD